MDVLVGTAASLRVDFESPLGMLIPDATSVTYQVFATDGTVLVAPTAVSTLSTDTGVTLNIAAGNQTITSPRRFEKRTVVISWTTGGQGHTVTRNYRVVPFLNMTASPKDVRLVIGVNDDELTDDEIDLSSAYFLVEDAVNQIVTANGQTGQAVLSTALATGTRVEMLANQAVIATAVVEVFAGLQQQVAQTQRDGTMVFQRWQKVDWQGVLERAQDMRARGIAAIVGLPETNETLLLTVRGRDVVTYWAGRISWP